MRNSAHITLCLMLQIAALLGASGCQERAFHNTRILSKSLSNGCLELLVSDESGHDTAPVGASSHGFVVTSSRIYRVLYHFPTALQDSPEAPVVLAAARQEELRVTRGPHSVDQVLGELTRAGIVSPASTVRSRLLTNGDELEDLKRNYPRLVAGGPDPLVAKYSLRPGRCTYLSVANSSTHVISASEKPCSLPMSATYADLWDPENGSLVLFSRSSPSTGQIIGFPATIILWRYSTEHLRPQTLRLQPPELPVLLGNR